MAEQQANGVATEQQGLQFAIQRIFVKDISFEAPNAPAIFRKEWKPEVQLHYNFINLYLFRLRIKSLRNHHLLKSKKHL